MKSAELKTKLEALQAELSVTSRKSEALKVELHKANLRIDKLRGTWGSLGEIKECQRELEAALRLEADEGKRRVRVPHWYKKEVFDEFVVAKVTPKRIYLRKPGDSNTEQFNHSGKRVGYGDPILPEDLAWILAEKGKVE